MGGRRPQIYRTVSFYDLLKLSGSQLDPKKPIKARAWISPRMVSNYFRPNRQMREADRKVADLSRGLDTAGVVYCSDSRCGWGWDVSEGERCPKCGKFPDQGSLKEAKKLLARMPKRESLERWRGGRA